MFEEWHRYFKARYSGVQGICSVLVHESKKTDCIASTVIFCMLTLLRRKKSSQDIADVCVHRENDSYFILCIIHM